MIVRQRRDGDITALCELVREVHLLDGYPVVLQDNVRDFVVTTNCLAAWVCETVSSLGESREILGSISRLFVAASVRGGLGERLIAVAVNEARTRGLLPVLDVVTTYAPAIALYERLGWTRLGTISYPMSNGEFIDEHVYAAPRLS